MIALAGLFLILGDNEAAGLFLIFHWCYNE